MRRQQTNERQKTWLPGLTPYQLSVARAPGARLPRPGRHPGQRVSTWATCPGRFMVLTCRPGSKVRAGPVPAAGLRLRSIFLAPLPAHGAARRSWLALRWRVDPRQRVGLDALPALSLQGNRAEREAVRATKTDAMGQWLHQLLTIGENCGQRLSRRAQMIFEKTHSM